jgi:hypothetical protein
MVQRILADRLQLVMSMRPRLRAAVGVAPLPRPGTLRPLGPALGNAAISDCSAPMHTRRTPARLCALGRKGLGDALLRHYGSIDGGATGGNGLRAQRAGGGRVDKAGVARVADAMHDGGIAVVGIRLRGLALDGAVGAGGAARDDDGGRLRARR